MTNPKRSKEYFAESEYGVKASPRVSNKRSNLPRGGGRDQVGKPYKVAGKWYYPKEDKKYKKVGGASWYGDAFHGRLTANGEIYDMTHLTAAHPTMPLPSYARVTNMVNGSSIIVRVNDRGPYSDGRIIDLSKKAAEMLDYAHSGVAKVKVEYVGRAPLDGNDESYLMASYHPGNIAPDPSDGLPTGVMVAMNGPSPSGGSDASAQAFPGVLTDAAPAPEPARRSEPAATLVAAAPAAAVPVAFVPGMPELPEFGPIFPDRPGTEPMPGELQQVAGLMSYADNRVKQAAAAFDLLDNAPPNPDATVASGQRPDQADDAEDYVAAGTFADEDQANLVAKELQGFGRVSVDRSQDQGGTWYSVEIRSDGRHSLDEIMQAAWSHGAPDALAVRD